MAGQVREPAERLAGLPRPLPGALSDWVESRAVVPAGAAREAKPAMVLEEPPTAATVATVAGRVDPGAAVRGATAPLAQAVAARAATRPAPVARLLVALAAAAIWVLGERRRPVELEQPRVALARQAEGPPLAELSQLEAL